MISIDETVLTGTERRLVRVLSDGMVHSKEELLQKCLPDDMGSAQNVCVHICYLRRKLPVGLLIVHVSTNGTRGKGYRMVRHIHSGNDGRV